MGRSVSRSRIYQEIGKKYPGTLLAAARRAIQKALDEGILIYGETRARFKLTEKGKEFAAEKLQKLAKKNNPQEDGSPAAGEKKKNDKSKETKKSEKNKNPKS